MFDKQVVPNLQARTSRRIRVLVVATFVLGIVVGTLVLRANYLGPGVGVADRVRAADSPLVTEVQYLDPNWFTGKPGEVRIYLEHDATQAEVNAFWCDVVVPAGGEAMPERYLVLWRTDQQAGESRYFKPDKQCSH